MKYQKGDICICQIYFEDRQEVKSRPVVFWDNWDLSKNRPTVLAIPFTSSSSKLSYQPALFVRKTEINNLLEDSVLKIYQIGCIGKNNLGKVIGTLTKDEIYEVERSLKKSFPNIYEH